MKNLSQEIQRQAYGYIRVSTSEQSESGLGLDVQQSQIEKYCKDKGIELIKIFEDPGFSGADADRPGLQSLIIQAKSNGVNLILLAHSSRLARDSMLAEIIYRDLRKNGITLVSVAQPSYYEEDGDFQRKLVRTILSAFDEYEKSLISWRLKNGRAKRVELGGWHGGWVYGYRHGKKGKLIINQKEADTVKKMFYLRKSKRMSHTGIARVLNSEGIPTKKKDAKWHSATVKKMLNNPIYKGLLNYRGKTYQGHHEKIIKDE